MAHLFLTVFYFDNFNHPITCVTTKSNNAENEEKISRAIVSLGLERVALEDNSEFYLTEMCLCQSLSKLFDLRFRLTIASCNSTQSKYRYTFSNHDVLDGEPWPIHIQERVLEENCEIIFEHFNHHGECNICI